MSEFKTADVLQITNDPVFILDSQFEVDCGAYAKQFAGYLKNVIVRPSLSLGVDGKPLRDLEGKIRYRRGSNPLPAGENDFGSNRVFQIPKGFRFDGASIPDFAAFLGKLVMNFDYTQGDPRLHTASVAHDWLYCTHQCEKYQADDLFFYMLLASDVSVGDAWAMWEAVVFNGDSYWRGDRKEKQKELIALCGDVHKGGDDVKQYFATDIIVAAGLEGTSAKA